MPEKKSLPEQIWIIIERENSADLMIGPYPDRGMAFHAMEDAALINGFCEDDALNCIVTTKSLEVVLIDLKNPDHTGRPV